MGALTRYLDDALLEIDRNAAERSLRSEVMGRKTICSGDQIPVASGPRRSTVSLKVSN